MNKIDYQEKKLDALFDTVAKFDKDEEIQSYLAKYLCVQASGHLENVIKQLIEEYHDGSCKKSTANFVNFKLKHFTNIDTEKLKKLLKDFDSEWEKQFDSKVSERCLSSLTSIISNRHLIAHGSAQSSNISYKMMVQYYFDLKEIIVVLRTIIKK